MKIALVGDVHANLPALEAVIAHARQYKAEAIWNVGDFVGYGAFPEEVVVLLKKISTLSIIGNYDLKVLQFPKRKGKWRQTKNPQKWFAFKWAYEHLLKESRTYLAGLPQEIRIQVEGKELLLTHGSPASNEESLTPETPIKRLRELVELAVTPEGKRADLIICGHSHRQFARLVDETWFINTGSVGRPDDGDPRACYALLQIDNGLFKIEHHRLEYDVERAVAAIRKHGLPEAFAQMLIQGRDLGSVVENSP